MVYLAYKPLLLSFEYGVKNLAFMRVYTVRVFPSHILRGSTHGGHYHAYIRDVDCLGKWQHPDEQPLQIPTDPATGQVDFIECDSPVELVQAILSKATGHGMSIDTLGSVSS